MERIRLKSTRRIELLEITDQIQGLISRQKFHDGMCLLFCPHTTAGLTINEHADPSVSRDISHTLSQLIPVQGSYTHSEGNSDSHIKAALFGCSLSVIVEEGTLMLGTWQGIFFCENDGPRSRELWVKLIPGA